MEHLDTFPFAVIEEPDTGIVMADGCRLSARIWRPEGAGPVPAIVEHLPYRKRDGTTARDALTHPWFAGHGYAAIRVDMRGNGDSDGLMDDEYTAQEWEDACAVIAWAAAQAWCDGSVGMMGISWGGFNALQVAALRPPALKAIITLCSSVDRYADDIHTKGGCQLGENFGWAVNMLSYSSRPPDAALRGPRWREMWLARLAAQPFHLSTWARHPHRDAFWEHGSICEDYAAITAATLAIGGWHDGYRNTPALLVENLTAPAKAIVGPWIHKYPHYAGPAPAIGFLQVAKRWWDRWLKGQPNGAENDPAYRAWLMDSVAPARWLDARPGRWIAEADWPAPAITPTLLHLTEQGLADSPAPFSRPVCSPQDCGTEGGEYFPFAFAEELPGDQCPDDAKSACFDGAPLTTPCDIVGAPEVRLSLAADRPSGQIFVRLCDVRPDGTSALITAGCLDLTHRNSHATPEPLTPGESVAVNLQLDQIAYRVPAGHRLRLAISTAYWPFIWPSPERTTLTLTDGALKVPIRPSALGDECIFPPPQGASPWDAEETRRPDYTRSVAAEDGRTVIRIDIDNGERRDRKHGLVSGSTCRERWSIRADDPTTAECEIIWHQNGGRPGAQWRTRAGSRMWCSASTFFVEATLQAWENDALVFEKSYEDAIPRG